MRARGKVSKTIWALSREQALSWREANVRSKTENRVLTAQGWKVAAANASQQYEHMTQGATARLRAPHSVTQGVQRKGRESVIFYENPDYRSINSSGEIT